MQAVVTSLLAISTAVLAVMALYYSRSINGCRREVKQLTEVNADLKTEIRELTGDLSTCRESSVDLIKLIMDDVHFCTGHSPEFEALGVLHDSTCRSANPFQIRLESRDKLTSVGLTTLDWNITLADVMRFAASTGRRARVIERQYIGRVNLCVIQADHERIKWFVETFSRIHRLYNGNEELIISDLRAFLNCWEASGFFEFSCMSIENFLSGKPSFDEDHNNNTLIQTANT